MKVFLRLLCAALMIATLAGIVALAEEEPEFLDQLPIECMELSEDGLQVTGSKVESPYFIKVNIAKNRLTIYKKVNGKWKRMDTKKCSTGRPTKPTPRGVYKIKKKRYSFTDWGQNWYYVTYFYKDYAIHSTGESGGKFDNSALGKGVSHGCVRLKPKDAKWVYDHIPAGTYIQLQ